MLEDRVLLKLDWSKENKTKPLRKTVAFVESEENSPLLEKREALTTRIDSPFKKIKGDMEEMRDGCNKCGGPHLSSDYDDKRMGVPKEEKANYAFRGYREIIMVKILAIGAIVNLTIEMKTESQTLDQRTLIDVLAGMPNYGKFLKDLVSNISKMEQISAAFLTEECSAILQNKIPPKLGDPESFLIPCKLANSVEYLALADLGASINLIMYSLYAALSETTLKPTRMNFVILQMEEDDRVPLILGRPFLHTFDAIIRVKNKELNLEIREDGATFHIDKAMQHSHVKDDTCFRMDVNVIDEITKDELDAMLDDSKPFLNTSEKISETPLDKEFDEFRTSIQDPPTDLEMKPLPKHLECAFLEENSLILVIISALLKPNEKERLVSVLKNHKESFAWKTSDIPGISPFFCKHKINFEDDVKPVIQRQRRLNPNMKDVVKKILSNF
ncbi:hypothetical protein Tco_0355918 [Tanacetum coccineum]